MKLQALNRNALGAEIAHARIVGRAASWAFHEDQALMFHGRRYTPDASTAYCDFHLAYGFPEGWSVYGDVMMPQVVTASAGSMMHKMMNLRHRVKSYDPENVHRDRIIGAIVDREMVTENGVPHVHALAALYKSAEGMNTVIGQHGSGRREWTVSMEFLFSLAESGFVVQRAEGDPKAATTPDWLARQGWDYVPLQFDGVDFKISDPQFADLMATRDFAARRFIKNHAEQRFAGDYKGRQCWFAMGGLDNPGHFTGVALVEHGAEVTARIGHLLAEDRRIEDGLKRFADDAKLSCEFFKNFLLTHQ